MLLEDAALDDLAARPDAVRREDAQLEEPVIDEEAVAGADVLREVAVGGGDERLVPREVALGRDGDVAPALEEDADLPGLQRAGADLRTLEVLEHGHRAHEPPRGAADAVEHVGVVLVAAMREVEARDVHAELEELVDCLGTLARGAERGDDLGAAHAGSRLYADCRKGAMAFVGRSANMP